MANNNKLQNEDVNKIKKIIRKNICYDRTALDNFKEELSQLQDVIERVVRLGESNSVLLIGPEFCGKATLVDRCTSNVLDKFGDCFTLVRLHGLVHVNDNLALQEIIRSLHVGDLPEDGVVTGNFGDNLTFVLQSFKSGNRDRSKPIVFVLEYFEMFCEHRNQTLLYNLFDVSQSAQAPLCVIGITSRIDITELFEKRVKSRFSQRQISIFPNTDYTFLVKLFENVLKLKDNDEIKVTKSIRTEWNRKIDEVLSDKSVIKTLKKISDFNTSLKFIKSYLFSLTGLLNESRSEFKREDFETVLLTYTQDYKVRSVKGLSILELSLIIAMKHQNEIYDCQPMNFEMVYKRYMKFAATSPVNIVEQSVVFKAFERLKEMEMIIPVSEPIRRIKKEYVLYNFVLTDQQIDEALNGYENLPTDLQQWSSSSLTSV